MLEIRNVRLPLDAFVSARKGSDRGVFGDRTLSVDDSSRKVLADEVSAGVPLIGGACDVLGVAMREAAARVLGMGVSDIAHIRLVRRSVDARKKKDVHFIVSLLVSLTDETHEASFVEPPNVIAHTPYEPLAIPLVSEHFLSPDSGESFQSEHPTKPHLPESPARPYVVGSGPAGLFAALYLARAGLRPILIEQGPPVEDRVAAIAAFDRGGELAPYANIQFGEGGAGTFSDGKLTTNTKNPYTAHVLQWFYEAGAPQEILWQAKPHMGTDLLVGVVRKLRKQIIEAGGEVQFNRRLCGLTFENGTLCGVDVADVGTDVVAHEQANRLILACGHSARDTFALLENAGIRLEQKPFSVGVRIEHAQASINEAQFGSSAAHPSLGAAEYKLAVHLKNGRGVYTFCMCPGGGVVCATSEQGGTVVNGMSRFARDGDNANSALLVGVDPADFGGSGPLAGVEFQRSIERAAYRLAEKCGGSPYQAPAQTVGDFLAGRVGGASASVVPTYARNVVWCDLRECLPPFVSEALTEALPLLDRKLCGFASSDAVLTGVETRSSSPVRICRDEWFQARLIDGDARGLDARLNDGIEIQHASFVSEGITESLAVSVLSAEGVAELSGLFPCGEGAGYAGGIMSAAVDGLRVAEALVQALLKR